MWSACNFTTDGPDLATAEKAGLALQQQLGAQSLEEMRNVPADRILAAQAESQLGLHTEGVRTPPLIDGYFTVEPKTVLLSRHEFSDVPIIASSNTDDLDANQNPLTRARTIADFERTARQLYRQNADEFLRLFPVRSDAEVPAVAHAAAREAGMLEASRSCAQSLSRAGRSPAFIGLFAHKHPYAPGITFADQNPLTIGAYHTADVPFWLGTLDSLNLIRHTRDWTDYDRRLSDQMLGALIAVAQSGRPKLGTVEWPAWSGADERYVQIGNEIRIEALNRVRMDWLASHPASKLSQGPTGKRGPRD
jgi:para-nitrobenzyl esterase